MMISNAKKVVTDSGGLQREAFLMGVPVEVVLMSNPWKEEILAFGDGHAEEKIRYYINEILRKKI
jgi:UDP-N-acetylglucosamine 2-epimerase